jgi:hypothetical protein
LFSHLAKYKQDQLRHRAESLQLFHPLWSMFIDHTSLFGCMA